MKSTPFWGVLLLVPSGFWVRYWKHLFCETFSLLLVHEDRIKRGKISELFGVFSCSSHPGFITTLQGALLSIPF